MTEGRALFSGGALIAGIELAARAPGRSPLLAVALCALALAAGGRGPIGRASLPIAALAVGLLTVWLRPPSVRTAVEQGLHGRAVTIEAAPSRWRRESFGWSSEVRMRHLVVGGRTLLVRGRLRLSVPGASPPAGRHLRARGVIKRGTRFRNGAVERAGLPRLSVKSLRLLETDRASGDTGQTSTTSYRNANAVGLARALTTGDTDGLSIPLKAGIRRAGLAHLLALSGLHVGILVVIGLRLGSLLATPGRWALAAAAVAVLLALAGLRPALLRATGMGILAGVALATGSRPAGRRALAIVAAAMLLVQPELLDDLGFLLTVAATGGIVWAVTTGGAQPRPVVAALRVSVAAQLATLPWSLPTFGLLAPVSILHNLWAVPWIAFGLIAAGLWQLATLVSSGLAAAVEHVLGLAVAPFELLAELPAGAWHSVPLSLSVGSTMVLALIGLLALVRPILGLSAGAILVVLLLCSAASEDVGPQLVMLDVGQGEALLVRDGGRSVLIDGGGWSRGDVGGRVVVPALARLGVRRLQALAMSHPDRDHCGGLVDVAAYLPAREIWSAPGWSPNRCFADLLAVPRAVWRPLWAGGTLEVGRWRLRVLHPLPGDDATGNDRSLVLRAEASDFSALLMGDLERRGERQLVARLPSELLRADLLKIGHHGSRTSTSELLLDAVRPRFAWISAGRDNRYGHPSHEVLDRLSTRGVRVLRTDRDGQLRLRVVPSAGVRVEVASPD